MIPPTAYAVPNEMSSPRFAAAWAQGCGGAIERENILRPGPIALFGSQERWRLLSQAIAEGRDWYYADHGYFGRFQYFRVTRNAYQMNLSLACGAHGDQHRLEGLRVKISPWRRSGDHILLCPPDAAFAALMGFDACTWRSNIIAALQAITGRPIRIRERACAATSTLSEDLAGAWCLVTYVSNAAVEAVCAGVPVICTGPCAAGAMGSHDIAAVENPPRPRGRRLWAAILAANQWTMQEIAAGEAWRALGIGEE